MIIGEIGNFFSTTKKVQYYSSQTLLEYDALVINLAELIQYTSVQHEDAKELYLSRKKQLEDFIKFKKIPLIYITPLPTKINFNKKGGGVEYVTFDFLTPIPNIVVANEHGSIIEILEKTPFTEVLTKYKQHFFYNSFFETNGGKPIAETPHTKKVLGFYDKNCVFIPELKPTIKAVEKEFFEELIKSAKISIDSSAASSLPEWAEKYYLPNEAELGSEIEAIKDQVNNLNLSIEQKEVERNLISQRKKIFTSSGIELESEVKKIFSELGFQFIESEQNRDDLILKYNDRFAVVEVKGITKTAAEKHAAQLEKWSANFIQKHDAIPKAILIVNTFKEIPLNERENVSFPDQMIKYSSQREHCLITTVQLLNLYYLAMADPSNKDSLIESIFTTVGVYKDLSDWTLFLKKENL